MKNQVNAPLAIGIIVVAVLLIGAIFWKKVVQNPYAGSNAPKIPMAASSGAPQKMEPPGGSNKPSGGGMSPTLPGGGMSPSLPGGSAPQTPP